LLREALRGQRLPFFVLYLYGPGGVGKTSLLGEYASMCAELGVESRIIDGRNVDPSPEAFLVALQQAMGLAVAENPLDAIASRSDRIVLLIDIYENLATCDDWLWREFLPQLPENALVVIASRQPPSPTWRANPGWSSILYVLSPRDLDPAESRDYLRLRRVPESQHQAVLDVTFGHPLALSLVADAIAQRGDIEFAPEATPGVVKALLEQFVQKVPGPAHRSSLEACSLVRVMTESLLAAMLRNDEVHDIFDWLRSLSFIEFRRGGLSLHDQAREALAADLRWRNPDWYAELTRRARDYYLAHLENAPEQTQQRLLLDYIYLHRGNAVVRPYFEWRTSGSMLTDGMRLADLPTRLAMVAEHEGRKFARLADFWFTNQPESVLIIGNSQGEAIGFLMALDLRPAGPADLDADPALRRGKRYLDLHAPLRPGERDTFFSFWMAKDTYQDVSPIQSLISVHIVRYVLTTPEVAFTFIPCAKPDFWLPIFTYTEMSRLPEVDFEVGGCAYGVYRHDWRVTPPVIWLAHLAERETAAGLEVAPSRGKSLIVLGQAEFGKAVRDALRLLPYPDRLLGGPLLRSRLVVTEVGHDSTEAERVQKLTELVCKSAESLRASARTEKFIRALDLTYLHPAATQEAAARSTM